MVRGKEVAGSGMDVGFICQGWPPDVGGVESHASDLARALADRGHRAHVLCLDYSEGREPYSVRDLAPAEHGGVSIRRLAYGYHDQTSLRDMVENERMNDAVMAWMAETPCDLVHVHHATGFGLGILRAIRDVGQPLVMTLHDYWALCPRGQMLRHDGALCARPEPESCGACLTATWAHLFEGTDDAASAAGDRTTHALDCIGLPHRLFTPSPAAREVYVRAGADGDRVRVVENGVDVGSLAEEVARLRAETGRDGDEVHLGVLGSVLPSKGVLELARAFVRADAPALHLDIHGNLPSYHGDTSYVDALRALAADEPRIHVHDSYARADLPRILASLDGVAAPSIWEEVYGLTVREAAAAGLPVLVSDAGGLPDLVAGADGAEPNGLVVPRGDEDAWVAALERFARDSDARAAWSGARPKLRATADMAAELESLYVEVIHEVTGLYPPGMEPEEPEATPPKRGLLGRLFGR